MSWWNTSNITSLASKALKNAQKKIDEALDISETEKAQSAEASGSAAQKTEKKEKGDSWGGWLGDTSSESSTSPKSSWSFPWGAGAEGGEENVEIREKTPEEIKIEVLKAAKERTKAKSKLFPQKSKTDAGDMKLSSDSSSSSTVRTDQEETGVLDTRSENVENTGVSVVQTKQFDSSVTQLHAKKSENKGDIERSDELVISEYGSSDIQSKEEVSHVEQGAVSSEESGMPVLCSKQDISGVDEEAVAKIDVSVTEVVTASLSGSVLSVSSDLQETEHKDSEIIKDSSFQELSIDTGDQFISFASELGNFDRSSSGNDLLKISGSENDFHLDQSSENQSLSSENQSLISEENEVNRKETSCPVETKEFSETGTNEEGESQELNLDVSSSVEIVCTKDIPLLANECIEISESSSATQVISDESFTDPFKISADEEIIDTSQSDSSFSVIEKVNLETSENYDQDANVCVEGDLDAVSKASEHYSDDFIESASSHKDLSEIESTHRSESESSINKLDVSQETCTSEETVIGEELNNSETSEGLKGLSKNFKGVSNTELSELESEIQAERTIDILSQNKTEQAEPIETEEEKVKLTLEDVLESETVTVESDITTEAETNTLQEHKESDLCAGLSVDETSDGSDSNEKSDLSPANSFVKCTLEDAMEDSKGDDNSDNHSATEKSDGSSRSIHSGHESADEIDTTTSSDIEIISLPTPNGENRQVSPIDPIPLRIALQKTSWRGSPTHRRSDSSGSSSNSKDGHTEYSPGRDNLDDQEYGRGGYSDHRSQEHCDDNSGRLKHPELPALDEEDDSPYHPQRLLKDSNIEESHDESHDHDTMSHDHLSAECKQKLAEMSEILQAREEKLLMLSKENCDLVEGNSILRNQLKQSEEAREAEMTDLNELTAEFTQRLTDSEKRVTAAVKEKDQYKKQLQGAQSELAKKAADTSLHNLLDEKEEQIQGLLQEGEKLSKSQLQSNTIIKKLRSKEKDNESTLATQKKKLESQKEEIDHLKKVLDSKEETEKKQSEALTQLQAAVNKQEIEMARLKSEHEDSTEKTRGLQAALDNSYKELAELHRTSAVQDNRAQEAALSAEMQVREELKLTIEKQQQQHKWEKDSLIMQIEDFQMGMARMEKDCNRREDMLKQEIGDLQKQLQEDEARTQELTQNVSSATRPLLRQIENLQSTYTAQSSTWEKVEKNLADRLSDTQNQLVISVEKERTANDQVLELGSKVTSLEAQNSRLRQEKSHLTAQLEMLKTKVELSEETKQNEAAQIEVMKSQMNQEITDLKKQKVLLETQLDVEKSKVEQEKKKIGLFQEQIRDLEREAARSRGAESRGTPSPVSISRQESFASSFHEQSFSAITQEEIDRSFYLQSAGGNKQSLYEALRQSGASNLLENLQSQLKLREGEITHLQGEIHQLERTRESMAKELVNLSNKNDELEEQVQELPVLQERFKDMNQRYDALLQMYGEKVEEANELRLDLEDVKDMYKAQINHLLANH